MWDVWKNLFLECVEKHAPLRTKRVRASNSPWITPQLKKRLHERDILKLKAIRSGNAYIWRKFNKIRNSTNNEVKLAKKVYFDNALKENRGDLCNTWRIINELTYRKSKSTFVNEVILNNSNSIHDPLELSEAFNDHFSNIGPRLANEIHVNENCPSYVDYLSGAVSTVFVLLSKLSKSKATDLGKISARLSRDCADLIASPHSISLSFLASFRMNGNYPKLSLCLNTANAQI